MKKKILQLGLLLSILIMHGTIFSSSYESDRKFADRLFDEELFLQASLQYQYLIDNYPQAPEMQQFYLKIADSYYYNADYFMAKKNYLQFLYQFSGSNQGAYAQFQIANSNQMSGDYKEAIAAYESVLQFYPQSNFVPKALLSAARIASKYNLYNKSISLLHELLSIGSSKEILFDANLLLSQVYYKQQEYIMAKKQIEIFLLKNPNKEQLVICQSFLGQIYLALTQYQLAITAFNISNEGAQDSLKQLNYYYLGKIYSTLNDPIKAEKNYQKALTYKLNQSLTLNTLISFGELYFNQEEFESAKKYFEQYIALSSDSYLFQLGQTYFYLDQLKEAEFMFKSMQDSERNTEIKKIANLWLATVYKEQSQYNLAVDYYYKFLNDYPDDLFNPYVLLQISSLYIKALQQPSFAIPYLQNLWMNYPDSDLVPQSKIIYAEYLISANRFNEAQTILGEIIKVYPMTQYAEKAQTYLFLYSASNKNGLLQAFLQHSTSQDLLASEYFQLKIASSLILNQQFKEGVKLLNEIEKICEDPMIGREAHFRLGQAYHQLYLNTKNSSFIDSAKVFYQNIIAQDPVDSLSLAGLELMASLNDTIDNLFYLKRYKALLDINKDDGINTYLKNKVASTYLKIDSALVALNYLDNTNSNSLILMSEANLKIYQYEITDSLVNLYLLKYPKTNLTSKALFLKGINATKIGSDSIAIHSFETLQNQYPGSKYAKTILLSLGDLYLKHNQFNAANELYNKIMLQDSLNSIAASLNLTERQNYPVKNVLYSNIKLNYKLGKFKQSRLLCFDYLKRYPDPDDQVTIFLMLAKISEKESKESDVVYFLNRAVRRMPSDSLYSQMADYYYKQENYSECVNNYDKAFGLTSEKERQAKVVSRIILAYLKQGEISKAIARESVFIKEYKRVDHYDEYMAEILIEKGNYYLSQKNFENALDTFEEVKKGYKRTSSLPEAELGIGKTYLITNHIEKALKLLSGMPEDYPDHPVLVRVYLNLGDHYFRSKQYRNALIAFQKATYDYVDPAVNAVAMRYLIRVYETLGMYDGALATTRQYLDKYPQSADQLQKRVQIGVYLMKINEFERAVDQFKKVKIEADYETEAEIQYWIGKSYANMGQMEKAILEFLKVKYVSRPTKLPWASTALYEAAQGYQKLNQPDNAIKIFEKIIQSEGAASDLGRIAQQKIDEIKRNK